MFEKHQRLVAVLTIICVGMLVPIQESSAVPTVTIIVNPSGTTEVPAGSALIGLAAQVSGTNLTYTWKLDGPGKLIGDLERSSIFYRPPDSIDGESEIAVITVTVTNDKAEGNIANRAFTIIHQVPPSTPTPTPTSTPISDEGMSKLTKVALGAGTAVAVGVGIYFLTMDTAEDNPFIEIHYPVESSQVNMIEHISGIAKDFKSGDYVSIATYSYGDNKLYPQTNIGIPDDHGNWTVLGCYFGRPGNIDVGVSYEIQAELKDTNGIPKARDSVLVTRK
jgi:hypothetical protein